MAIPIPQELTERIIFKTVTGARNAVSGLGTSDTTAATAWAHHDPAQKQTTLGKP